MHGHVKNSSNISQSCENLICYYFMLHILWLPLFMLRTTPVLNLTHSPYTLRIGFVFKQVIGPAMLNLKCPVCTIGAFSKSDMHGKAALAEFFSQSGVNWPCSSTNLFLTSEAGKQAALYNSDCSHHGRTLLPFSAKGHWNAEACLSLAPHNVSRLCFPLKADFPFALH